MAGYLNGSGDRVRIFLTLHDYLLDIQNLASEHSTSKRSTTAGVIPVYPKNVNFQRYYISYA